MSKIFISGSRGELGSYLHDYFGATHKVFIESDSLSMCDVFIHCLSRHPTQSDADNLFSNITKSKELISNFNTSEEKKLFIFMSSVSLYDFSSRYINENSPLLLDNIYKMSKAHIEQYIRSTQMDYLILRLPGLLEKNQARSLMSRLFTKLSRGDRIVIEENPSFTFFVSMERVAHYCTKAIENFRTEHMSLKSTLNCFENGNASLSDLVFAIRDELCSTSEVIVEPVGKSHVLSNTTDPFELANWDSVDLTRSWVKKRSQNE